MLDRDHSFARGRSPFRQPENLWSSDFKEQEDRHSSEFSLVRDLRGLKSCVSQMRILARHLVFVTVSFWDTQLATGNYPRLPLRFNSQ